MQEKMISAFLHALAIWAGEFEMSNVCTSAPCFLHSMASGSPISFDCPMTTIFLVFKLPNW